MYFSTNPLDSNLSNLLIVIFSPIVAIFPVNTSSTVFASSFINFCVNNSSTVAGAFRAICSAISLAKVLNSSFLPTKSVSEFISTTLPVFSSF